MTSAERIQLARAEEQVRELEPRLLRRWERDTWAVRAVKRPPAPRKVKRPCLAGDCGGRVVGLGYCRRHLGKVRFGVALDVDMRNPRRGR